jgi:hypothetical protein
MNPVLNKLLTVQLLIQKRTEGIVFDNDAKGCYDIIISGVYGSSIDKLLYGIGQCSCASPILWELINQLLLAALGEKFTCIRLLAINSV